MVRNRARPLASLAKERRKANYFRLVQPHDERADFPEPGSDSPGSDTDSSDEPAQVGADVDALTHLMRPELSFPPARSTDDADVWSVVEVKTKGAPVTLDVDQRQSLAKACLGHTYILPQSNATVSAAGVTINSHPRSSLIGALSEQTPRGKPRVTNAHFITRASVLPGGLRESLEAGGFLCGVGEYRVVVGSILRFVHISFPGVRVPRVMARVALYPAVGDGTDPATQVTAVVRRDASRKCWLPAYMLGSLAALGHGAPGHSANGRGVWSAFEIPSYTFGLMS